MKRWIHAKAEINDENTFTWNGWFFTKVKQGNRYIYLKSKNVRFDEYGNTTEISFDEYTDNAEKHYEMFGH